MDKAIVVAVAVGVGVVAVATVYGLSDTVLSGPLDSGVNGLIGAAQNPGSSAASGG